MNIRLKSNLDYLLKIFYPDKCIFCQAVLLISREDLYLCPECQNNIPFIDEELEMPDLNSNNRKLPLYISTSANKFYFDWGMSCFHYIDIKNSIFSFKYSNCTGKGKQMAELMFQNLDINAVSIFDDIDLIIPIPLHIKRLKNRGFNQSDIIGSNLAALMHKDYNNTALVRTLNTTPQHKLSKEERYRNIKNAFSVEDPHAIDGKKILLIDDIYTTGSTLNECAKVLKLNGAENVFFYTLAVAGE